MTTAIETRLNLGCGDNALPGFINIDMISAPGVNQVLNVPPLPWADASINEIYAGHFFEHLSHEDGETLLAECLRVLVPGGKLGIVVPDFREVARRYVMDEPMPFSWHRFEPWPLGIPAGGVFSYDMRDLDVLCFFLLYSTVQLSHHQWMYDLNTLGRALRVAGFDILGEIDRLADPRVQPAWYQCGLDAVKPAV